MTDLTIYIGWDSREQESYEVAYYSAFEKYPGAKIYPLKQQDLRQQNLYWRKEDSQASTEFSLTRFLVPLLNEYQGYALYMDCDVLVKDDVRKMVPEWFGAYSVACVKHDYVPKTNLKKDMEIQYFYPRKNWSSVMLFNCGHVCSLNLTAEYVNSAAPSELHRMKWADESIYGLDPEWNCLSGYYDIPDPKIIHYTDGGPWLEKYSDCDYADDWKSFRDLLK